MFFKMFTVTNNVIINILIYSSILRNVANIIYNFNFHGYRWLFLQHIILQKTYSSTMNIKYCLFPSDKQNEF